MKKKQILLIAFFISLTICAFTSFHVARADPLITQPITVSICNSANYATVTINGGNPSPSTFLADGSQYSITMDQGATFTLSFSNNGNTRYGFSVSSAFADTSPSYTASTNPISVPAYEQVVNTFSVTGVSGTDSCSLTGTYMGAASVPIVILNFGNSWSDSAWSDYGGVVTFPASTFNSGLSERWSAGNAYSTVSLTNGGDFYSQAYIHQFYLTVVSAHGSPSQGSEWVNVGSSFAVSVVSPDVVTSGADQWVVLGPNSQTISDVESAQTLSFSWSEQFYLTVFSTHGGQTGQGWYYASTNAYAGLTSGTVSGDADTQYVFSGWSGDTSGNVSISSNPIIMDGPRAAIANWKTQYQVTFATSAGGSNSPTGSNVWEDAGLLSIMATPNNGYTFFSWSSNTGLITFDNATVANAKATIGGPGTINATFVINSYTITVAQSANGVIAPGTSSINYGGTPIFNITPNVGYHIVSITANGGSVAVISPSGQSYQFSAVLADGSLTATFAINVYKITVTPPVDGSLVSVNGTSVNYGDCVSFSITPSIGHHIANITVDGGLVSVTSPTGQTVNFTSVHVDHIIAATFVINSYTITVAQSANGVIAPGTSSINYGGTPIFNITPNVGYHIVSITANGGSVAVISPSGQSYQFSAVLADGSLTATFAINVYKITVTPPVDGSLVSVNGTSVNYGDCVSFSITPSIGHHIANITVDGGLVSVTSPTGQTVNFTSVHVDHIIAATFVINSYTITVAQSANGVIAPGTSSVDYGGNQTFTITPDTGYSIASLTIDGLPVTVESSYIFNNVQTPHTITATFAPIPTPSATPVNSPSPTPTPTATPMATPPIIPTLKPTTIPVLTPTPTCAPIGSTAYVIDVVGETITPITNATGGCIAQFVVGDSSAGNKIVNATAIPKSGYIFDHWVLDGKEMTSNSILIEMNKAHTVQAIFQVHTEPTPTSTVASMGIYIPVIAATIILGAALYGLFLRRKKHPSSAIFN